MNNYKFEGNQVILDKVPGRLKKLTATRFATVMGLNAWSTPFSAWCEITKTYEKPFEDTIYTKAGKVIEPKIGEYLNKVYFLNVKSPTDVYGPDYFKKTWGDFFPDNEILGGMWDYLGKDFVVEIKTTKRAEDWSNDIPIYYKLQACLYAYLLKMDRVIVVVSFLEDKDYTNPEKFEPNYTNTKTYDFSLSEAFPNFEEDYVQAALDWWNKYVMTGISPEFDEKKDADILKELRTNKAEVSDEEVQKWLKEADKLRQQVENNDLKMKEKKDRLKQIDDKIKKYMTGQFRDGDKKVEINGQKYHYILTKSIRNTVDTDLLKENNLYEKYLKESVSYTLKNSLIEV